MAQQNITTGKNRALRRTQVEVPKAAPAVPSREDKEDEMDYFVGQDPTLPFTVHFAGLSQDIENAIAAVDDFYASRQRRDSVSIKAPLSTSDVEKLRKRLMKLGVTLSANSSSLDILGIDTNVIQAKGEVTQFLLDKMESSTLVTYPFEWVPQNLNYELSAVDPGSAEWVRVENRMKDFTQLQNHSLGQSPKQTSMGEIRA